MIVPNAIKKIEAARKKKQQAQRPSLSARKRMISTGAGPDGVVQPDKPVGMMYMGRQPRLIHEGETMVENQQGGVEQVIPAPQTMQRPALGPPPQMQQPSEMQQSEMQQLQDQGMQGYQGGFNMGNQPPLTPYPVNNAVPNPQAPIGAGSTFTSPTNTVPGPGTGTGTPVQATPQPAQPTTPTTTTQSATPAQPVAYDPSANLRTYMDRRTQVQASGIPTRQTPQGPRPVQQTPGETTTPVTTGTPVTTEAPITATGADPYESLQGFMEGDHEYYKRQQAQALNELERRNRFNISRGMANLAADPETRGGTAAAMQGQLLAGAGRQEADVRAQLGGAMADKMYQATQSSIKVKQDAYDRVSDLDVQLQDYIANAMSSADLQGLSEDEKLQRIYGQQGYRNIWDQRQYYQGVATGATTADTAGVDYIRDSLGNIVGANMPGQRGNLLARLQQEAALDTSMEDVLQNDSVIQLAANALGLLNGRDAQGNLLPQVQQEIERIYREQIKTSLQRGIDFITEDIYKQYFEDNYGGELPTQLQGKMNEWAQDLLDGKQLKVDDKGNVTMEGITTVPWEDPDTMYDGWVTADGQAITYDSAGNMTVNGQDYNTYVLPNSQVLAKDFADRWNNIPESEMERYTTDDGDFDMTKLDSFMRFSADFDIADTASPENPYYDKGQLVEGSETMDEFINFEDDLDSWENIAGITEGGEGEMVNYPHHNSALLSEIQERAGEEATIDFGNHVVYRDENGEPQKMPRDEGNSDLKKMWYQASMKYNNGTALSMSDFAKLMETGDVAWDGENLIPKGQAVSKGILDRKPDDSLTEVQRDSVYQDANALIQLQSTVGSIPQIGVKASGRDHDGSWKKDRSVFSTQYSKGNLINSNGTIYEVQSSPDEWDYKAKGIRKFGQQMAIKDLYTGENHTIYALHDSDDNGITMPVGQHLGKAASQGLLGVPVSRGGAK